MSFIDARLNSRYRYGFQGGPAWNTMTTDLISGRQRRAKLWSMPHHRYTADYATFTESEKNELLNAFMASAGSFSSFRFKDWNDWTVSGQQFAVGDGTAESKQLVKSYTFGVVTLVRPITLPLNPVVTDENGDPIACTVDPLTGLATPDTTWPVGAALIWTGQFDVRVHFAEDFNPFTSASSNVRECRVTLEEVLD